MSSQVDFKGSSRRPTTNRRAPNLAKWMAIERPSPLPPPVRNMARSFRRPGWNMAHHLSISKKHCSSGEPRKNFPKRNDGEGMCPLRSLMRLKDVASRKFDVEKSEARIPFNILNPDRSRTQKFDQSDSGGSGRSPTV